MRDEFLHQRREHRIDARTHFQRFRQLPLDRQRMAVRQQSGPSDEMFGQGFAVAFNEGFAFGLPRRLGLRTQHLPGKVVAHAANPGDDLVAEQRMIGRGQQMRQDRRDPRKRRIALREGFAQRIVAGALRLGCGIRDRHDRVVPSP